MENKELLLEIINCTKDSKSLAREGQIEDLEDNMDYIIATAEQVLKQL